MLTATDQLLVQRIRAILRRRRNVSERKMFGSLCFLLNGHMCVAPWKGGLVVRLSKEEHVQTQSEPHVGLMDITGRVMKGWAVIEPAGIETEDDLKSWVIRAATYVASLPPKT